MPVKRLTHIGETRAMPDHERDLVDLLVTELQEGTTSEPRPRIYIEDDMRRRVVHLYVVWERWLHIGHEHRSEMILTAYAKVFPEDWIRVTLAMGLTEQEADNMHLRRD